MLKTGFVAFVLCLVFCSCLYTMEEQNARKSFENYFRVPPNALLIVRSIECPDQVKETLSKEQKILFDKVSMLLNRCKDMNFDKKALAQINSNRAVLEIMMAIAYRRGKHKDLLSKLIVHVIKHSNPEAVNYFSELPVRLIVGEIPEEIEKELEQERTKLQELKTLRENMTQFYEHVQKARAEKDFFLAVRDNKPDMVLRLIKAGVSVNTKDDAGNTALIWSAELGNRGMIEFLLFNGADAKIKNNIGQDAVDRAENRGKTKIIRLLKFYRDLGDVSKKMIYCVPGTSF